MPYLDKEKRREYQKQYRLDNKEKKKKYSEHYHENYKDKISKKNKEWRENNKQKISEKKKEYRENNKKHIKEHNKEYYENNKKKIIKRISLYNNSKKTTNPLFKLSHNIRSLISNSIVRQGYKKESKTYRILGCTFEEFKLHLERQFVVGMNWDNQGKWHLDHIIPVSLAKDEEDMIKLNHYTNFQPLWAADNLLKGNKVIANTQIKLI
jgi:hypothetical protein